MSKTPATSDSAPAGDEAPAVRLAEFREAMLASVPFHGWSDAAMRHAARSLGLDEEFGHVLYPGGIPEFIQEWQDAVDLALLQRLPPERLAGMRIRDRIRSLVMTRLELLVAHREAVRQLVARGLLPAHAPEMAQLVWRSVDRMWRAAGDRATDINYYTKRTILAGIWSATLLVWLDDRDETFAETRAFLDRRIDGVMRFEKWKAEWRKGRENLPSLARFLGRLRYPPAA
ncbi:MAG: COQ9 family protein [Alphaproteobacteria bacterium]|nr:MAG: COQ9 family protein [Alphaproteobacteria bacterium]